MEHSTGYNYGHNNDNVYFQEKVNVPFSWEYKPGLSKVTHEPSKNGSNLVLQPPPRSSFGNGANKLRVEDSEGPFILCAVQPSTLGIRSFRLEDKKGDPFVEAFKKCTETPKDHFMHKRSHKTNKNNGSWPNIMKYMHVFSCKFSGDVVTMV